MGRRARLKRQRKQEAVSTQAAMATAQATAVERFERLVGRKVAGVAITAPGAPKMSDTLLDFAQPLLRMAGRPLDAQGLEGVLSIASAIWNAYLLGDRAEGALDDLRGTMASSGIETAFADELLDLMLERRRELHGEDRRLIGGFAVVKAPNGKLQVTATYLPTP